MKLCNFSNNMMASRAVSSDSEHLFCAQCATKSTTKSFDCGNLKWSSLNNQDHEQSNTEAHPHRRGIKRPACEANAASDEADEQSAKERRYQPTSSGEKDGEVEMTEVITTSADSIPESAVPDINAAGESVDGSVLDTAITYFNASQRDELPINERKLQTIWTGEGIVRDGEVRNDDGGEIFHDADLEESELLEVLPGAERSGKEHQTVQTSTEIDISEAADPVDDKAASIFRTADGKEVKIMPGKFHEVVNALRDAGLVPPLSEPLVDKAAKFIYRVAVDAVVHCIKKFK